MKQVTIDTVRERIAELEMVNSHGEMSLRGEFELACLRMLADSMVGVDDDVRNVVSLLENNEWAEHCTKTELGQRLESEITRLVGGVQPWPVPDEMTKSLASIAEEYQTTPQNALFIVVGWNACRAKVIGNMFLADMDRAATRKMQELTTCNTAQQFEALATSGKSEHLLNAERIAREAKALSDRLNATSAVNHRVSGWSERQQKVIAYSLWRFSCTAYQKANQAAQTNNKDMFDRFIRDARCAEEIREEFTSAWSGKP